MTGRSIAAVLLPLAILAGCGDPEAPGDPGPDDPGPQAPRPDFLIGGDISFLPEIEDHGGSYADAEGQEDLLLLLKQHGFNAIRLKLWHTPADDYNTLDRVKAMAARIDAAGLGFLLDIHYSDSWADPGQQTKPAAWDTLSFPTLVDSVRQYSRDVIAALRAQGTVPSMVQIGNEIRPGMLWPEGRVDGAYDTPQQWDRLVALLNAGRQGVLDGAADQPPRIVIHFDNGADNATCRWFFDRLVEQGFAFDVIGLSYYPKWHGTLEALGGNLADLATRYGKDVAVVETAYPWTLGWNDGTGNVFGTQADLHPGYPATVSGQSAFLRAVRAVVSQVPGGHGLGVYYWSPEWIAVAGVPSAWENATLFDFDGLMLPSLPAFTGRD
jgi:arabinogalactan endo-1,4-beta-galactosidase